MKNSMYALLSGRSMILSAAFLLAFVLVLSNCNTSEKKVASGEELFQSYCAICHGTNGAGNGAMTEHLKLPPADLTKIAARRGGNFPDEQIYQIIDGRVPVAGHGTGDMPIWGQTLKESEQLKNEKQVRQSINNLVGYLKSIQQQ
ncbi:MAG TPA: cytochrome c [Saprospiraceae bacterium]|nr:cytochrome c [Saprospiraceae bacterium]HRF40024.1 cytochrome c [Saprospiraceae bacterium]HRK80156.1 cytochrome c [Saprospiraceae bacterium]